MHTLAVEIVRLDVLGDFHFPLITVVEQFFLVV